MVSVVFRIFSIFSVFTALTVTASAIPVEGIVDYSSGRPLLYINSQHAFQLTGASSSVIKSLKRLRSGDFLIGEADVNFDSRVLKLKTLDIVGLSSLIGTWENSSADLYQFKDFKTLKLYKSGALSTPVTGQTWRYRIAPGDGNAWSIFISRDHQIFFGTLDFKSNGMQMTFFDSRGSNVFTDQFIPVKNNYSTW